MKLCRAEGWRGCGASDGEAAPGASASATAAGPWEGRRGWRLKLLSAIRDWSPAGVIMPTRSNMTCWRFIRIEAGPRDHPCA